MKKLTLGLATALLLTTISLTQLRAANKPVNSTSSSIETADVKVLLARLNEIKAMDVSTMTRFEKRALREEVRSTKEALRNNGHSGIYISTGAVIIILLLIILL